MASLRFSPHAVIITLSLVVTAVLASVVWSSSQKTLSQLDPGQAQVDPCEITGANANLVSIQPVNGYTFSLSCMVNGSQQYQNDARFSFFQLNSPYSGMPYIKTQNSEIKDQASLSWSMTLNRSAQVFLFFRRIPGITPTIPSWAQGYSRITPDGYANLNQFMLRKNADNGLIGLYDIWQSNTALSGQIHFGPASDSVTAAPAYSMYLVGLSPQASPTSTAQPTHTPLPSTAGHQLVTSGVVYNSDSSANSSRTRQTTIRVPEALITTSQGWIAGRIKMGFPSTTTLSPDPNIFDMSESDALSHFIYYDVASDTFHFERTHSGGTVNSAKQTFAAGDIKTVIVTWSTTQIKISIDGGAFVTLNNGHVTGPAPFTIGSSPIQGASRQPNSDYYWVAAGTEFLTDANAQAINAFGNTDHARADFPGNATFMWDAQSDTYNNH